MLRAALPLVRRLATDAPARAAAAGKLKLSFAVPHEAFYKNVDVDQVNLPSTAGDMGVLADHVPTIAQLRPGVIEVIQDNKSKKFVVSGGFAIMNPDSSLNITAVEAATLDQLDVEAARRLLVEAQRAGEKAATEADKASAEAAAEVYQAVISAQ
eukprot:Unigene3701_Nuclearia_a/m.11296 Unigene3701_Nuclearia_a/g.11296  ORF Unigene3701_Nuclearia_a/g.11296 Unigene3701_Nuclearia_a/m.11296 type:complete len:155 (+) Unigene3701_Nuclearia_a:98-562(+)